MIVLSADDFTRDIQDRGDFRDCSGMVPDAQRVMMGWAGHDPLLDERPGIRREEAARVGVAGTIVRSTGDGLTIDSINFLQYSETKRRVSQCRKKHEPGLTTGCIT